MTIDEAISIPLPATSRIGVGAIARRFFLRSPPEGGETPSPGNWIEPGTPINDAQKAGTFTRVVAPGQHTNELSWRFDSAHPQRGKAVFRTVVWPGIPGKA